MERAEEKKDITTLLPNSLSLQISVRTMSALLTLLFLASSIFTTEADTPGGVCRFDSHMGATFNLEDLVRFGDMRSYDVTDGDIPCTPDVEQNFTYVFNVCNQVSGNLPPSCVKSGAAFQIDKRATMTELDDFCFVAGRFEATTAKEAASYFSLYDQSDPSKGVKLTYYGDQCHHNDAGEEVPITRKFELEFTCEDNNVPVPVHALEYKHCEYTVTVPSVYGCPVECPVVNRRLCNGKGHCAYDHDKRSSRCFCDMGFAGEGCSTTEDFQSQKMHQNSTITGIVITLFVLIGLLGVVTGVMFKQVKAYKEDATNYMALAGGDFDEGGV